MRVLVACEYSGVVRDAFTAAGHDAMSCDLLPSERPGHHYQGDVFDVLDAFTFDLMIAHPPCTFLCSSGLFRNKGNPKRQAGTEYALAFVRALLAADVPRIALENPVGKIGTAIRPASQYVHPHMFGHDASKKTGLWLKNLPPLTPTAHVPPRLVDGRERWANQTDSGQNKLSPGPDRWKERSRTYAGLAAAMADQWSKL